MSLMMSNKHKSRICHTNVYICPNSVVSPTSGLKELTACTI